MTHPVLERIKNPFYSAAQVLIMHIYSHLLRGDAYGQKYIPATGGFLLASNHLSFMDPPLIGACAQRPIFYFARSSLFKPGFVSHLLYILNAIAVDREAEGGDFSSIKKIIKTLENNQGLLLFPEGTRSKNHEIGDAKAGVGFLACKTRVPVVPVRIFGSHHLLSHDNQGWDWQAKIAVGIGQPLYPQDYDRGPQSTERYQQAANVILSAIRQLQEPKDSGI